MSFPVLAAVVLGTALLSGCVVWASIRVAYRTGMVDRPDGGRKTQDQPIPRLGGVAVAVSFSMAALGVLWFVSGDPDVALGASVLLPALLATGVGFADDLRNLRPSIRLTLQVAIAWLAWLLGTRIELTGVVPVDVIMTIAWFMVVVNGINLLDNSDGLAGSTVFVSGLGATIIAAIFGQELVSLLGASLVGVSFGFLWRNWHPARVYMGDSGAYFLGFLLATLVIRLKPEPVSALSGIAIALLLVALPLVDTTFVVLRRLRARVHPFTAGRDHLAHMLQGRGLTVPTSVLALQILLIATTGMAIGIAVAQAP